MCDSSTEGGPRNPETPLEAIRLLEGLHTRVGRLLDDVEEMARSVARDRAQLDAEISETEAHPKVDHDAARSTIPDSLSEQDVDDIEAAMDDVDWVVQGEVVGESGSDPVRVGRVRRLRALVARLRAVDSWVHEDAAEAGPASRNTAYTAEEMKGVVTACTHAIRGLQGGAQMLEGLVTVGTLPQVQEYLTTRARDVMDELGSSFEGHAHEFVAGVEEDAPTDDATTASDDVHLHTVGHDPTRYPKTPLDEYYFEAGDLIVCDECKSVVVVRAAGEGTGRILPWIRSHRYPGRDSMCLLSGLPATRDRGVLAKRHGDAP